MRLSRSKRWVLVALLLAVGVTAGLVYGARGAESCDDYRFDRAAWGDARNKGQDARTSIAERLVECEVLIGKTQKALREMLGQADYRFGNEQGYELGPDAPYGVDSKFLLVVFGDSGRVKTASLGAG